MSRRFLSFVSVIMVALNSGIAQSPYELSANREIGIFGGATIVGVGGLLLQGNIKPFTPTDIKNLKISSIPKFDRQAVFNNNAKAGRLSDQIRNVGFFLPTILLVSQQTRSEWPKIMLLATEGLALTSGLTTLAKSSFKRTRPFVYNEQVPIDRKMTKKARKSFFPDMCQRIPLCSSLLPR